MHERQAIKKRVKSLLEGIWLSFYCYPATTGYLFLIISDQQFIDRFSFLGYGTDGTEDADSLDMETGIVCDETGAPSPIAREMSGSRLTLPVGEWKLSLTGNVTGGAMDVRTRWV